MKTIEEIDKELNRLVILMSYCKGKMKILVQNESNKENLLWLKKESMFIAKYNTLLWCKNITTNFYSPFDKQDIPEEYFNY